MDRMSERRLAENEVFFREQNESIEKGFENIRRLTASEGHDSFLNDDDTELHFFCECSNVECRLRIQVRPSDYNQIHVERDQFIVLPGHELLAVEQVVGKHEGYYVVRKMITPPATAKHLHGVKPVQ